MAIEWWQLVIIMVVIIALILVPIVSWYIHKRYAKQPKRSVPPLMYITTVSSSSRDVDIPTLPDLNNSMYMPPSYEEICKGVENEAYMSSNTSLNIHNETLPDYASVASGGSSFMLSTFHNDAGSSAFSTSAVSEDSASESDTSSQMSVGSEGAEQSVEDHDDVVMPKHELGIYKA